MLVDNIEQVGFDRYTICNLHALLGDNLLADPSAAGRLRKIEVARDVFAWGYERSCLRYTVVRDALPQPDPLRLRNRDHLTEVVNAIVRDDAPIDDAPLRALAAPVVAPDDLEDFIAMAIGELSGLHEGNLARYRLRPSEFRRWRGQRRRPPSS